MNCSFATVKPSGISRHGIIQALIFQLDEYSGTRLSTS